MELVGLLVGFIDFVILFILVLAAVVFISPFFGIAVFWWFEKVNGWWNPKL